ncbi:uncharacterized protein LOC18434233 isoform X1 [Amborella trichopoda]|nr:uncharacterized protein LOC18434233 isoform X1 [Amborella trichopoda]|eukprot:XP_006844371.2 uncharacterized protein LOC18434233 isoform X1 [Amborella trichopoda]
MYVGIRRIRVFYKMENNVEFIGSDKSFMSSKSVDVESLYIEKPGVSGGELGFDTHGSSEKKPLKRSRTSSRKAMHGSGKLKTKHDGPGSGKLKPKQPKRDDGPGSGKLKKRRGRKEVSLNSLEPLPKKRKRVVNNNGSDSGPISEKDKNLIFGRGRKTTNSSHIPNLVNRNSDVQNQKTKKNSDTGLVQNVGKKKVHLSNVSESFGENSSLKAQVGSKRKSRTTRWSETSKRVSASPADNKHGGAEALGVEEKAEELGVEEKFEELGVEEKAEELGVEEKLGLVPSIVRRKRRFRRNKQSAKDKLDEPINNILASPTDNKHGEETDRLLLKTNLGLGSSIARKKGSFRRNKENDTHKLDRRTKSKGINTSSTIENPNRNNIKRRRRTGVNLAHVAVLAENSLHRSPNSIASDSGSGGGKLEIPLGDEQENLEQNAARMLSSRFNPSFGGISGKSTGSRPESTSGSSLKALPHSSPKSLEARALVGGKILGEDRKGRVLRPRKHEHKGVNRKRRRFVEVKIHDSDALWAVNRRINVYWPLDKMWYRGIIKNYDPETKLHNIHYDDRDEEWLSLESETFKILVWPGEASNRFGFSNERSRSKESNTHENGYKNSNERSRSKDSNTYENGDENSGKNMDSFMESEPIISWLARSLKKANSSPNNSEMKKLSGISQDKPLFVGPKSSSFQSDTGLSRSSPRYVYVRKRFHKRERGRNKSLEESLSCKSTRVSVSFLDSVADQLRSSVSILDSVADRLRSSVMDDACACVGIDQESKALLLYNILDQAMFLLVLPQIWKFYVRTVDESFWVYHTLMLLHYGTLVALWPKVQLEMLIVDSLVGLRLLQYEGCLIQAVNCLCLILSFFCQSDGMQVSSKMSRIQSPVTSIRFKLSYSQGVGRHLVLVFYNFLELRSSKWRNLDGLLRDFSPVTRTLPLADCMNVISSTLKNFESLREESLKELMYQDTIKAPVNVNGISTSGISDGDHGSIPLCYHSFATMPTSFFGLHMKLSIGNPTASTNFQSFAPASALKNALHPEIITSDVAMVSSPVEDSLVHVREAMQKNLLEQASAVPYEQENVEAHVYSNENGVIKSPHQFSKDKLNVNNRPVGSLSLGKANGDDSHLHGSEIRFQGYQESSASVSEVVSSPNESEAGCISHDVSDQSLSPLHQVTNLSFDGVSQTAGGSNYLSSWDSEKLGSCRQNPTGPRSIWPRNRFGSVSSSFSYRSKLWQDGVSRKPRSQLSGPLRCKDNNVDLKPAQYHRRGRPYKQTKIDKPKRIVQDSGRPRRGPESLSCDANVLVTTSDRGWRECGAQVVLESLDRNDWRLVVKLSGSTKYSLKALNPMPLGTTNRFTHAMMWRGGNDWSLEFVDRAQWVVFKEMYDECCNLNSRARLVKNIPIPGVRRIEVPDSDGAGVPFIRTSKYIKQVGTEVDMALVPSRVVYDMDGHDEEWLEHNELDITEEMFERAMDKFEKVAYAQQHDDFTVDEVGRFTAGIGPMEVMKAIYEYWQQKRLKLGMPLIRQFQPPLWERYQRQMKEWESRVNHIHNASNGSKEKATLLERPPMFAFCLRPRGLEVPNKGSKQRSQRKLSAGASSFIQREHDSCQVSGRKLNGFLGVEEKSLNTIQSIELSEEAAFRGVRPRISILQKEGPKLQRSDSSQSKRGWSIQRPTRNGVLRVWGTNSPKWSNNKECQSDGMMGSYREKAERPYRDRAEHLNGANFESQFRVRDAASSAQHASNLAKLKRIKAEKLFQKADLALHKAFVALLIADAIQKAEKERDVEVTTSQSENEERPNGHELSMEKGVNGLLVDDVANRLALVPFSQ